MVLTAEMDRLSHEDQLKPKERKLYLRSGLWHLRLQGGMIRMVWLQTLSFSCSLESIQTVSGHLLCVPSAIHCHRHFGVSFTEGAALPLPEYSCVVPEYCQRDVEESPEK